MGANFKIQGDRMARFGLEMRGKKLETPRKKITIKPNGILAWARTPTSPPAATHTATEPGRQARVDFSFSEGIK